MSSIRLSSAGNFFKELPMKNTPFLTLATFAALTILLPACFNPITVIPPKSGNPLSDPFTIDILIDKDGSARSVAGPDSAGIKGDLTNIIQLIVVDKFTGQIIAFDEVRRENDTDKTALLSVDSLTFGRTYDFLLLMGHWERDYNTETANNDGKYIYKEAGPPTLLAAGLKELEVTGSGRITVVMWPLMVDTLFTTENPDVREAFRTSAPVTNAGKPGIAGLLPVDWNVTWTVTRGTGGNGFTDLIKAQKVTAPQDTEDKLRVKSKTTIIHGAGLDDTEATVTGEITTGNVITLPIGTAYTSGLTQIGKGGSVNIKLEYVPFNLTDGDKWTPYKGRSAFNLEGKPPVWVIRNGVNDLAQDGNTDFTCLGNGTANGNGGVRYTVAAGTPAAGTLVIKDGGFIQPAGTNLPEISFTTQGYKGEAAVYYAVVPDGGTPEYVDYLPLNPPVEEGDHRKEIMSLDPDNGPYDVYVILVKGGEVSAPVIINAAPIDIEWGWADDTLYMNLYVKSDGDDGNTGTREHPLATIGKGLEKLAAAYTAEGFWPDKGKTGEAKGKIVVLDTVTVREAITINNTGKIYPSITLSGDPAVSGEKLQADKSIGLRKSLLNISGADVTLSGGLILRGTGVEADVVRGVYVSNNSRFTMIDGEISGHSSAIMTIDYNGSGQVTGYVYSIGGGVLVSYSSFIMSGGVISNNAGIEGSGVGVSGGGTFTMTGGVISGNKAYHQGGGVMVDFRSTFIMSGGVISGNSVCVHPVYNIVFNDLSLRGAGVMVGTSGNGYSDYGYYPVFRKTGGTIYGYTSGNEDSNVVKNSSGAAVNGKGHAVYSDVNSKYKDSTVSGTLYVNYPSYNQFTGWCTAYAELAVFQASI
jgi:hypothetical protein